jgi:hypothetical protein
LQPDCQELDLVEEVDGHLSGDLIAALVRLSSYE